MELLASSESILQLIDPEGSMRRFISALAAGLLISGTSLLGQAQAPVTPQGTEKITALSP